jgi:hypothetical protein
VFHIKSPHGSNHLPQRELKKYGAPNPVPSTYESGLNSVVGRASPVNPVFYCAFFKELLLDNQSFSGLFPVSPTCLGGQNEEYTRQQHSNTRKPLL